MARARKTVELEFLGTGTSAGVPVPGCRCAVCRSKDPRDKRLRSSALVRNGRRNLIIDASPEFRIQCLRAGVFTVDALVLTHGHADHTNGFDDIRSYSFFKSRTVPVWGDGKTLRTIERRFDYVWHATQWGGGLPQVELRGIEGPFTAAGLELTPIPILHGALPILGFRIGDLAYLTDVSRIPESSLPPLEDLRTLIVSCARTMPHETHFNLADVKRTHDRLRPERTLVTHISHYFSHRRLVAALPPGVDPAQDGMRVAIDLAAR
ncbi:MAG: MBL fold metallo-hydrolase [Planctomycetota bacterium]|jgi:phosphoribosyl 1,2-cyclic phosphate phosphodiesterase|nr:MBL fold metallo-hydrolase [Planctomycetota bacterium]